MPVTWIESNDNRKVSVTAVLVEVACSLPTDGRLNRRIYITGSQPIPGGAYAIDIDPDSGLAERAQHRQIGNAGYGPHDIRDLVGGRLKHVQVAAVELYRVLALHARCGLLDIVLNILGEVEINAGECLS